MALDEGPVWAEERIRDIKILMGELPEDTPRLTLEDVEGICNEYKGLPEGYYESEFIARFNEIAGAPDEDGGSGIAHRTYYFDDEHTEGIHVAFGRVSYHDYVKGTKTVLFDQSAA